MCFLNTYDNFDPLCVYSAGWLLWTQKCRPQFDEFFQGCNGNIQTNKHFFFEKKDIAETHVFVCTKQNDFVK